MRAVLDARTSTGYGDRGRPGVHGVLDIETVRAAADTAASLLGRTAAGEKISGQAARRALTGALKAPRFEGTLTTRQAATKAAKFLARDGIVLFDNPDSFLICAFKRDTALCDPEPGATAPNQFASGPGNSSWPPPSSPADTARKGHLRPYPTTSSRCPGWSTDRPKPDGVERKPCNRLPAKFHKSRSSA
ncbi:hypothetical protein [Streptomyces sp. NBC_00078]|uniref:hypothetical protein n=1 Tax=unclassified Streptomyces TaxID=2593676 RepID=UPI002251A443|nr:hypothetical protein [Streptomyces sp. NBC_00078]MCX5426041.1 hypothetical protein [Streptomyces sp. NBC_00078]